MTKFATKKFIFVGLVLFFITVISLSIIKPVDENYTWAQDESQALPGSADDPLITRNQVDEIFTSLEKRMDELETRVKNLPEVRPLDPGEVQVVVDGKIVKFEDQKPFINPYTNRTVVPLRFVMQAMGASVEWLEEERKVVTTKGNQKIILWINKTEALVNGDSIDIDQPPVIINDRTMIPLRFFSVHLGYEVEWDGQARQAKIRTK